MKKLFSLLIPALIWMTAIWAQSPQKMSYQAVVRDASGKLITNKPISVRITIIQGSAVGAEVFKETYNPNPETNANGLVTLEIGSGVALTGTFEAINWANGPYFLKTETDPTGGTNYTIVGTSQLLSTPYALYAKTAESVKGGITETDPVFNSSVAKGIKSSDTTRWGKKMSSYTETDPVFSISIAKGIKSSDTAKWNAKSNFSGNYTDLKNKPTLLDNATIVTTSGSQTIAGIKTFSNDVTINGLTVGRGNGSNNSNNTAIGTAALVANTTGSYNTANGATVLKNNTTGAYNTGVGNGSLYSNTSGVDNSAMGFRALYTNTSGLNNTALGYASLFFNTTGYANTATGYEALYNNTKGYGNVANGVGTLLYDSIGYENTADGLSALLINFSGNYNTAIGSNALSSNTTGNNNTAIGSYADVASNNLTNSTAIGSLAVVNASNKVRIGNDQVTVIEGQVAFTNLSDRRVKKDITDLTTGLDFILKLRPVAYKMKQGDDKINYGFIAQDIEALVGANNSMLTIGGDKDHTLGLRYTDFIAPMVKAMQEQQSLIAEDKAKIHFLEETNKQLENRLKAIEDKLTLK